MKPRTTWILLGLALIVAGVVIWDQKRGVSTEEARAKRKRIVDLKAEDVTRVELVRSNQTIELAKEAGRWMLKQPLSYRASASAVSSMLGEIAAAEADRFLLDQDLNETSLAEFGLATPPVRVKLQAPKGTVELVVGHLTPTKEAVYVQVAGEKRVAIVPKSLQERLATKLGDLREHDVLDMPQLSITRLEIRNADRVVELTKASPATNAEPRWAISKPLDLRADQHKVGGLASELSYLRVAEFIADDVKDLHAYQLDEPVREVTIYSGDKSKTLQFGKSPTNDPTKVYARLKGTETVFTVSAETAQKFAVQPNDLRDPRILELDSAAVTALNLAGIEVVADSNQTWRITAPQPLPADQERVKELLGKLSELTATQFVADVATDLARYGLASPLTLTVRGGGTNVLAQLQLSAPNSAESMRYLKRADEPFIYGVSPAALDWMPANALALRQRRVADFEPAAVTQVSVTREGKTVVAAKNKEGQWTLVEPKQGVLDVDGVQQLIESLSQLEARQFLREGRDLPTTEITIVVNLGEKSYTALVSPAAANGERQVAWSEPALVFATPGYNLTAALRDLVSLPPPAPAPAVSTNAPAAAQSEKSAP